MLKVGLTGGLATGKSFVGDALGKHGCRLLRADDVGREVMRKGGEAFDPVVREFGPGILAADGSIDRKRLAAVVFEDPARLAALNAIVHPAVLGRQERLMAEIAAVAPAAIVVWEAAVMIEAGTHTRMNKVILTVCTEAQQIERATARGGLTREEALARIRRQMPLEEKRRFADYVIDTSGSEAGTLAQTERVYNLLQSVA
jgi:dephospho-CoA kinase